MLQRYMRFSFYCLQASNVQTLLYCRGLFFFFEKIKSKHEIAASETESLGLCCALAPVGGVVFQLHSKIKVTNIRASRPNICWEDFAASLQPECRQNTDEPLVEFIEAASIFTP